MDLQRVIAMINRDSIVANCQYMLGKDEDNVDLIKAV